MTEARKISKRGEMKNRHQQAQHRNRLITIIIIAVAAVAIAAIVIYPYLQPPFQGKVRPQASGSSMGNPNAPVKVQEFSDFQCPYCRQFTETDESTIIKNYIEPGKVYFTYVPFSFIGAESIRAAEAAYCAMDQGKFWDYHDILFANQAGENTGNFSDARLKGFAQQLKLNMTDFNACFDTGKYQQKVQDDINIGKTAGVNATPYFLVNNKLVDMTTLSTAIDAALQGK
jgi:protein-disulfide isomerase